MISICMLCVCECVCVSVCVLFIHCHSIIFFLSTLEFRISGFTQLNIVIVHRKFTTKLMKVRGPKRL